MFCPKCGTQNPDGAKFCKKCGYSFPASPGQGAPAPSAGIPSQPGQVPQVATPGAYPAGTTWNATRGSFAPVDIASFILRIVIVIALFMPAMTSPLLKYLNQADSTLDVIDLSSMGGAEAAFATTLLKGEWSIPEIHDMTSKLSALGYSLSDLGYAFGVSSSSSSGVLGSADVIVTIVYIVWILMVVYLIARVVLGFVARNSSNPYIQKFCNPALDLIVMCVIAGLALAWGIFVIVLNNSFWDSVGSGAATARVLAGDMFAASAWTWIILVLSLVAAFLPRFMASRSAR
jgi:hypothetical protein